MASILCLYYISLLIIYNICSQPISHKTVCNSTNCANVTPPNLYIECKSIYCELECSTANACNNILYSCGNLDDYSIINANQTTTCTINCVSANSCSNLTVISNSGETYINCNTADSCTDSAFICNPSLDIDTHMMTDTKCILDCTISSCTNIKYLCTGYTSTCDALCNDANACTSLDMTCDQHLSRNDTDMECNLFCSTNNAGTCDTSSTFSCTQSSGAICDCNGNCNALRRFGVYTSAPTVSKTTSAPSISPTNEAMNSSTTTTSSIPTSFISQSHTFNIIDVEVYAVFTILWLLLFVFSLFLCWRLQITLNFFRNARTVVMLVVLFVIEIFYYWIFSFILWANAIAYSVESSIHFYIWSSYLPIMLHISLLFSLCAYYNKHFHRDRFLRLFVCYAPSKRKIPKIVKQLNLLLFMFFMIPMIGVIAAHTNAALTATLTFIVMFGFIGLFMAFAQFVTSIMDITTINNYEQIVERALIIFVLIAATLFVIIFSVNLAIAFSWNATKTSQNIEGLRITQLLFELFMLILMIALVFYIYYDYIMDTSDEEEVENTEPATIEKGDSYGYRDIKRPDSLTNTNTDGFPTPIHQPQQVPGVSERIRNTSSVIYDENDMSEDEDDEDEDERKTPITRRSTTNPMRLYHQTSDYDQDIDDGYHTGDTVDVVYPHHQWNRGMISETMENVVIVRILEGTQVHDEIEIDLLKDSDNIRLSREHPESPVDHVKKKSMHSPPPSIDSALAKQSRTKKAKGRKLPELPLFGAPLTKQKLVNVQSDDYEYFCEIPFALVVLKRYLFKFNGGEHEGIFANGSIQSISSTTEFIQGVVSRVDVNGVKRLVESGTLSRHRFRVDTKTEERHYAMVFSELMKLWLLSLPEPLLQEMPPTFFGNITSTVFLEMESEKISEPNLSTLFFIWDICAEISMKQDMNRMSIKRLSEIFAPYLYKHQDVQRNAELTPTIVNFCEIGINWRIEGLNDRTQTEK